MSYSSKQNPIEERRTFAIISHPDAGKTTLTEKLLLWGGAIQLAGTIKSRKSARYTTSDWMELEKQRGISVTTSVMQFPYHHHVINLLDTPGHADFTEDTYRTLTAVDSALMVIDAAKGVESRTIKLLEVCRLRTTPIISFINKMDRDARSPIELLDEIESVLNIQCAPITWPIGMGQHFKGIYHFLEDRIYLYRRKSTTGHSKSIGHLNGFQNPELARHIGKEIAKELGHEIELIRTASHSFNSSTYRQGKLTPVFFGSAINNFGIQTLLDFFIQQAPGPQSRITHQGDRIDPTQKQFSGFVFKIQANMDPHHRDRLAFLRIVSGEYQKGMRVYHQRLKKTIPLNNALTFLAGKRGHTDIAFAGDIIGIHNYGSIQIGDTFTTGKDFKFIGIPHFSPELFRLVRLKDPLKQKALLKGLTQLSEEGATQVFRPLSNNDLILGAVGNLQFEVIAYRLQHEYKVNCIYEPTSVIAARWIEADQPTDLEKFKNTYQRYLAIDANRHLTYLAPTQANLAITIENNPKIRFQKTRET